MPFGTVTAGETDLGSLADNRQDQEDKGENEDDCGEDLRKEAAQRAKAVRLEKPEGGDPHNNDRGGDIAALLA